MGRALVLALVLGVGFAAGFAVHACVRGRSTCPASTPKMSPENVRGLLLDTSKPWFNTSSAQLSDETPAVIPPIAARTDQPEAPRGVPELPPAALDFLCVTSQVRDFPLPANHPFRARHFEMVDLRTPDAFEKTHIVYSTNVPYARLTLDLQKGFLASLERSCILVVYGERYAYTDAFRALREAGFVDAFALAGGFKAWSEQGYPKTERPEERTAAPAKAAPPPPALESTMAMTDSNPAPTVTCGELREMLKKTPAPLVVFVSPNEDLYKQGRIPGAKWVPFNTVREHFGSYARDTRIVFYCGCCQGATEGLSGGAVRTLQDMGFKDVWHLKGHMTAWKDAGFEVEKGTQ